MTSKPTILVVDDNAAALKATARILQQAGYEVAQAADGAEALSQVRALSPSLVLLDVVLPDVSGTEVLRQIRADPALARVSVVLMSALQTMSEQQADGLDAGADGYIARPITRPELLARVRLHLRQRELTEQLRASESRFRGTFELAAVGIAHVSTEGGFQRVNDKLCAILGYTRDELLTFNFVELTLPEERAGNLEARRAMLTGELPSYNVDKRYQRKDGSVVWVNLMTTLERTDAGEPKYFISVLEDITERKMAEFRLLRLNRLHTVLSKVGEAIVRTRDRQQLYDTVCRIVVEEGLLRMAFIGELDLEGARVRSVAAHGRGVEYFGEVTIATPDGPMSQGVVGTAFRAGGPDFCNDIASDPRMAPWRERALRHGIRATAAFPLKLGPVTVAVLTLIAGEADYFQDDEIRLMTSVANDLSFALEAQQNEVQRQRAEDDLRVSESNMAAAQHISHFGSWEQVLGNPDNPDANPLRWSDEMYRIAGFEPGAVPVTRQLFFDIVHPDDRELLRQAVATAIRERRQYSLAYRLIRPDGEERVVYQTAQISFDEKTGAPLKMIGITHDITERKRAQHERDQMFNLSLDLLSVADLDGWLKQVNPAWTQCLGWTADELTSRPMLDFISPEDLAETQQVWRQVSQGQLVRNFENRYRCKDGSYRWLSWSLHPVLESREVFAVAHDATRRKETEQALRQNEQEQRLLAAQLEKERARLAAAQTVAKVGSWETDLATLDVIWSEETYRIFETDAAKFLPTHAGFLAFVHPDDYARVDQAFRDSFNQPSACALDHRVLVSDGRVKTVEERWQVFFDGLDKPIRAIGTCQDITERKRTEEALRESEVEFRTLAEAMPQIVWVTRPDGWNTYFSEQWMKYTGLTLDESLGHGGNQPFHPEDREPARKAWQLATATGGLYSLECRLRRADGAYRWWLIRGVPQHDTAGRILKWIGTCTDIHDLKLAELEISRSNRALKMLSSCNEALIRAEHEQDLLNQICRIAVEIGGYCMAWVGYAQDDELHSIVSRAHAGAEEGYLSETKATWGEESLGGQGPSGRTIRTGLTVVCNDMEHDASFAPWWAAAQRRGYHSSISLPLREGGRTFGALGLYSKDVRETSAEEFKLLHELAANLAFGIVNLRARLEMRSFQAAVLKVAAGVSASGGTEFFEQLVRHMAEALGAHAGVLARLLPGEPHRARTVAAIVERRATDNFEYALQGTPCELLLASENGIILRQISKHFPAAHPLAALGAVAYVGHRLSNAAGEPVGLLFVLFREPLEETDFITSTLQIFATRAASELDRQQTDAQVREQAALLDATTDAVILRDMEDQILLWNRGAEHIYGWTAAEAIGQKSCALFSVDPAKCEAALRELKRNGHWRGEMHKLTKTGHALTMDVRWTVVRDSLGKPKSILAINTDITEKKKMEAQFLRAQRMESIGTLAGGVAHDLNNVLAPILMAIEILKKEGGDPGDQAVLETLRTSAQRGVDLVKQVLSFARGVEGERLLINPVHVMRDTEKIIRDTFPKNIEFRSTFPRGLWTVTGDPTQLHQVFMNLCVNARDAMPNGGKLSLTLGNHVVDDVYAGMNPESKPGAYVVATVLDTGTGIPVRIRERIFEPFFTTKEIGKGTGLGLSTTLAIVKSHGGFINLYSEIGNGTRFKVYLPATTTAVAAEQVAIEQTRLPRGNGELILVVDDEEAIRNIAHRTLERFGYRVLLAANGAEAVAQYARQQNEIALVLTDMAMPIMDGAATIVALRALNPDVKIIGTSGFASSAGVAKAVGAGIKHFMPKPYTAETILQIIATVLKDAHTGSE